MAQFHYRTVFYIEASGISIILTGDTASSASLHMRLGKMGMYVRVGQKMGGRFGRSVLRYGLTPENARPGTAVVLGENGEDVFQPPAASDTAGIG